MSSMTSFSTSPKQPPLFAANGRAGRVRIILGTGLGKHRDIAAGRPFPDAIHFPRPPRPTRRWQVVGGTLKGKAVAGMEGRHHFYEGHSLQQVTCPVRVMKALGAKMLIVSNACGGMNPQWEKGDLMLIEDHINLLGDNPLIGPNDDRLGDRFPDMCHAYDRELLTLARRIALEERIPCQQGVFVAVSGPNLETAAEYRFLRGIGADVVGMSTVPEVIVAVHSRLRVPVSPSSPTMSPGRPEPVSLPDIIRTANAAEAKLRTLVRRVVAEL